MKNLLLSVWTTIVFAGVTAGLPQVLPAQNKAAELPPVTKTFAITHVNVISSPGTLLEDVTVIIKNGLISDVGKNVPIPGEAETISADSMFLYAGFIAGLTHTGIPRPEGNAQSQGDNRPPRENPVNPPADVAGIQTDQKVIDLFDANEKSIAGMREAGFTIAHIVPRGKMLPGSGAIVLMREGKSGELILRKNTAQFSQFTGASGVYPATLLGVMAKWKELYHQASLGLEHETIYEKNPVGVTRPAYEAYIQAFYPVVKKEQPVIFKAENVLDIQRAMSLQKELGFSLMLAEVKQGWDLTSKIKSQNVPVFLSLELPKEIAGKKPEEAKKDSAAKEMSLVEKEKAELEKKQLEAYHLHVSQAAAFEKAGVPFGFSMLEAKPKEALSQIRTMIKNGLSEDAALAALTTSPAKLLGISNVTGTVEKGKIANLVLTDKPLFEEKSAVKYVFVEGKKYEMNEKPAGGKSSASADVLKVVAGTWNLVISPPQMSALTGKLVIKNEGGSLSGNISHESPEETITADLDAVESDGKDLRFSYSFDMGGQMATVEVSATIEDNKFSGTMTVGELGSFPIEGEKEASPENN
ncbi:MAG: amidohydrolase family protein [Bacteroidia bacterium]|nr:amidohydrolase family protein [Bacteroidia bacterium]